MKLEITNENKMIGATQTVKQKIMTNLTINNPAYDEAIKRDRWIGNLDRKLIFYRFQGDKLCFPRGFGNQAFKIFCEYNCKPEIIDYRLVLPEVDFKFLGELREYQVQAVNEICKRTQGVLKAPPASGKTVMALKIITKRKQPTLILVHTRLLLNQWADKVEQFLGIQPGKIGDGKFDVQDVTIGTVQTVVRHMKDLPSHFGQLIVDECHRTPANIFMNCVQAFDSKYLLGLSATPFRSDGLDKVIYFTLGDLVHEVNKRDVEKNGFAIKPEVVVRKTGFTFDYSNNYSKMISALVKDEERNQMIAADVMNNTDRGTALVVSDRVEQLHLLASLLNMDGVEVLTGKTNIKKRKVIEDKMRQGRVKVLLSTINFIGEGFDDVGLCDLYLASPISSEIRLTQTIGRVRRPQDGKKPRVFDYQDRLQPVLESQGYKRLEMYS